MKMKKILAFFLALSLFASAFPLTAFADETEVDAATAVDPSVAPSDNLFVDKTVKLEADGTYTIDLSAYATGTPITKTVELGVPLDVVLVVDQSGSLKNSGSVDFMKNSIRDFMNALKANGEAVGVDHRVSICSFAGDDLAGLSGPADEKYGYSFAGDLWDLAWLNTGLYVDGKFQDYGTVEYTRIDSLEKLDTTRYYLVKYTSTLENGSSVAEYFRIYYYEDYASWYIHNGKEGLVGLATRKKNGEDKTTSEDLIAKYEVYDIGESTLQLDQADYAASWEYIADGQGNLNADVAAAINSLASNGGTRTSYGLKMARNMLKYITPGTDNDIRKKVVVVFTDGKAGAGWNSDGEMAATLAEANKIKASGVDIYTVGVYNDSVATDIALFMNQFSSNCGVIEFSENPTTVYEDNNLHQDTWVNSVTGRYRTLPSFYKVENEDGTEEFYPVRVCVETRYRADIKSWVVTPPYKWTYITDTGEMPIPTDLLNEDGTAIKGLYKIGSGDYNSEAGYYQTSNSFDNLSSLFQTVLDKETIFSSEVELGTTAILKDVLADGFTLTDNTQITVSVVPGSVSKENSNLSPNELTSDKITWSEEAKQVLTMNAREKTAASEPFVVTGAFDQTEMTLTATAENGEINVTGYNYAAQFISKDHVGSKLVVTVTGVEAVTGVTTNAATSTNKATSGVYEGPESDADKDGIPGEIETPFPVPNTYLTSEYYYLNENNTVTINPRDFLMNEGINISDGYHFFNTAEPGTTLETDYGTVTVNGDGTVTYQLKEGVELEKDIICLFGKTEDATVKAASANANGYMWSKITIYPPKNVQGDLHLDKSASLEANGTYTIDLEAFATGTPVSTVIQEGIPLDVVLVIDQSGSLARNHIHDDLKNAVSAFVEELKVHGEAYGIRHRVSMAGFACGGLDSGTGVVGGGYPMANDPEDGVFYPHWINTGLFVNGEFKNYGTVEYDKIESASEIGSTKQRLVFEFDYENDGIVDRWYTQGNNCLKWDDIYLNEEGVETKITKTLANNVDELFEKYPLYRVGGVRVALTDDDYTAAWEYVADGQNGSGNINQDITRAISRIGSNGATRVSYGLKMASKLVEKAPDDHIERKTIVVVFTDGVPACVEYEEGEAQAALAEAKKIKEKPGVEIYSIGVYANQSTANQAQDFMAQMSSNYSSHQFSTTTSIVDTGSTQVDRNISGVYAARLPYFYKDENDNYWPAGLYVHLPTPTTVLYKFFYKIDEHEEVLQDYSSEETYAPGLYTLEHTRSTDPNADYYRYTLNVAELKGMFKNIVTDATTVTSEVTLDASSILKDVMADGFTLTDNTTITVSVVPGSVRADYTGASTEVQKEDIVWGEAKQVLTFAYNAQKQATSEPFQVTGAADQTEMIITADATEEGVITVSGFNYANPTDNHKSNAQYIGVDHPGSKLVVTITGVEAKNDVVTDGITATNKGISGIYESEDSDMDGDGVPNELQASFPIPTTYLSSKTYYVDDSGKLLIDPADFLMDIKGINADVDGYNYFATPGTTIELKHGTVTVQSDGKLLFTMDPGNLGIADTFYLFGTTNDSTVTGAVANADGNMWSKITIIKDTTGKLYTDKTATLTGDGTYTIDLSAFATGTPSTTVITEGVPLDVVLVVDQSASMAKGSAGATMTETQGVVENFVKALYENGESFGINHRISICGFGTEGMEGTSHCVDKGYSYADEQYDQAWINTGIFVNGGFKKYGKAEYTPVTSAEEISEHGFYLLKCEFEERDIHGNKTGRIVTQFPSVQIDGGFWRLCIDSAVYNQYPFLVDENGKPFVSNEVLFKNYGDRLYKMESHALQLTPADFAASWENLANGANGTGGVNPTIQTHISKFGAAGCTRIQYGLNMARQMLKNIPDANDGIQRKKIVVVFADGLPSYSRYYLECIADPAMVEAGLIKDMGVEIYSVSLANEDTQPKQSEFMTRLSSNCPAPEFKEATFDITKAQAMTNANFMLNYAIPGISYAKAPLFYKVGDKFYQIVAYWPKKTEVLSGGYLSEASDISVHYITDAGDKKICEAKSVKGINLAMEKLAMEGQPVYEIIEPVVNDQTETKYLLTASSVDELSKAFGTVANEMTTYTTEVALDSTAILKDVMADGFTLTDNTTITVSVVPGSVKEQYANLSDELTADHIAWDAPQQVLSFAYPAATEGTGKVVVTGAADQTEMTLKATATKDGVITVTGFNYASPADNHRENAQYICAGHPGSKLVVTITGVEAKSNVVTDHVTVTNKGTSGIYEGPDSDLDDDGEKGEMQSSFPVPTTYMASKVYVVDYAKTLTVDPADFQIDISAISVDADGYNYFKPATTVVTDAYGKVTVSDDGKITYTPTKTNWNGYDSFYVFGTTDDKTVTAASANTNGNMWAKVSVIPANNVYFEDTFVTSEDTGIAGIVYGGVWDEVDKDGNPNAGGNGQGENAESGETADDVNQGGVHGWEDFLADDKDFSDGSAHVSTTPGATATFTFTGTGVDIYSRTNMETGIVMAMLYEGESTTDKDGKNLVAKYGLMVDNLAASGDYYQIPTLSLCQIPVKDENGNTVMEDLPYGTYTVMLVVSQASASQTGEERFTYYLDGIRVYNPIQEMEKDSTVSGAYGDKELNAKFVEIRDKLLDANSFSAEDGYSAGPVFIDRITSTDGEHTDNTESWEVGDYRVFGPENEVYLSAGQIIAFAVEYNEDAHYYIGMKSLTGEYADVLISDPDGMMAIIPVEHTTDMYYELSPAWEDLDGNPLMDAEGNRIGIITVEADWFNGDYAMDENWEYIVDEYGNRTDYVGAILALTKLKVTGPEAKTFKFARVSKTMLLDRVQEIANTLPDVENPDSGTQIEPEKQLGMVDKWNIALQEDFEVKFYLQISEDIEDAAKVSLTIGNGNITYDVSALEKTEDGYYLLKARLAATQMSDKISVQIIHGEDKGEIFTYTVREYCDTILSKDEYSAYHALVKEMLNYGAMAQMYFNYDVQNLANAGMTGAAAVAVPETAKDMAVTDKLSALNFYGASLVYRDKIALRYYFTGDVTGLTFTANGKTYEPVAKDGMHYVEIADILPQNVDQQITLTVTDANGNILAVTYGPMNYIVRMNVKGNDALKNLMSALYNYHLAAKALYQQ